MPTWATWKNTKKVFGWILVSPFILIGVLLVVAFLNWALPNAWWLASTNPSKWSIPEQSPQQVRVPRNDPDQVRMDYFIVEPREINGWETLPTEVERVFPVDGIERYTGMNISLLQGCALTIQIPGNQQNKSFVVETRTPLQRRGVPINEDDKTLHVDGQDQLSGALMINFIPQQRGQQVQLVNARLSVTEKPGHIRVTGWKAARAQDGGVLWGRLPDPKHFKWTLYVRFADENGMMLPRSIIRQHPGQIVTGNYPINDEGKQEFSQGYARVVSEDGEDVSGDYIYKKENSRLYIGPPDIGKPVYIEVILDVIPLPAR